MRLRTQLAPPLLSPRAWRELLAVEAEEANFDLFDESGIPVPDSTGDPRHRIVGCARFVPAHVDEDDAERDVPSSGG